MANTITFSQSVAANTTAVITEIEDSQYNPLERDSNIRVYCKSTAAGTLVTVAVGGRTVADRAQVFITAGSLSTRDHLLATLAGLAGQKLLLRAENTTAGALVFDGLVVLEAAR